NPTVRNNPLTPSGRYRRCAERDGLYRLLRAGERGKLPFTGLAAAVLGPHSPNFYIDQGGGHSSLSPAGDMDDLHPECGVAARSSRRSGSTTRPSTPPPWRSSPAGPPSATPATPPAGRPAAATPSRSCTGTGGSGNGSPSPSTASSPTSPNSASNSSATTTT